MFSPFVISGVGVVSPFGDGTDHFIKGYLAKSDFLHPIKMFSEPTYQQTIAGEIADFSPKVTLNIKKIRMYDRLSLIILCAIEHAMRSSNFIVNVDGPKPYEPTKTGIAIGTLGPIKSISDFDLQRLSDPQYLQSSDFASCVASVPLGFASLRYQLKGCNFTISSGETSSLETFGIASVFLGNGKTDLFITGGAEELSLQYCLLQQNKFKFDNCPNIPLSEGGVSFICESAKSASIRGVEPFAEVLAYSSCFGLDGELAFRRNCDNITQIMGTNWDTKVTDLFSSEIANIDEKKCIQNHATRIHTIKDRIGFMFSAQGAFKIAASLVDPSIDPANNLVVIHDRSNDGASALLVLRKKRGLE